MVVPGVDLSARRAVQPQVGRLVLFPSFMSHGTVPFTAPHPRLTVAFDVMPLKSTLPYEPATGRDQALARARLGTGPSGHEKGGPWARLG